MSGMTNTLTNDERNAIVRTLTRMANGFDNPCRREVYQLEANALRCLSAADLNNLAPEYVARLNRMVQA